MAANRSGVLQTRVCHKRRQTEPAVFGIKEKKVASPLSVNLHPFPVRYSKKRKRQLSKRTKMVLYMIIRRLTVSPLITRAVGGYLMYRLCPLSGQLLKPNELLMDPYTTEFREQVVASMQALMIERSQAVPSKLYAKRSKLICDTNGKYGTMFMNYW